MLDDGGYQVGKLAKCFYPTGFEISSPNNAEAEAQTLEWVKQEKAVLFEPAIRFETSLCGQIFWWMTVCANTLRFTKLDKLEDIQRRFFKFVSNLQMYHLYLINL